MSEELSTGESLEQATRRIIEENAILTLIARCDDAIIRRDRAAFGSMWTDDAVWEIGQYNPDHSKDISPLHAQGREQILTAIDTFNRMNEFFFRTTLRGLIEINGDRASVRSPTTELARRHDGHGYNNVALYEDELVKQNGQWLFAARRYFYVWVDSFSPIAGSGVKLPDQF